MGTNAGRWMVGRGMFVGIAVLVIWLLSAAVERAMTGGGALQEGVVRLHPAQYALAAITACAVGLVAAWPRRGNQ